MTTKTGLKASWEDAFSFVASLAAQSPDEPLPQPQTLAGWFRGEPEVARYLEHQVERLRKRQQQRFPESALPQYAQLTRRERQILRLLLEGKSNHTMARLLDISERTAAKHVQNIYQKLSITEGRTELIGCLTQHRKPAACPA